ncbi:MAG: hypothetical protein KGJ86_03730 [Chloroflexota bacterium]|nr:hypothetical protein [Chloroflexota bacterium]
MSHPEAGPHLQIVVAPGCEPCVESRLIAREARERFPRINVELIELDGQIQPPEAVVATPTYLLNGRVISLGNPRREELYRRLEACQNEAGPVR